MSNTQLENLMSDIGAGIRAIMHECMIEVVLYGSYAGAISMTSQMSMLLLWLTGIGWS